MKLITFTVPCYNSAEYMHVCIESLLKGGDKVEIVIVNDGSKDNTGEIADRYKEQYPDIIKVVHQETGGHGEGINQGIRNATGKYFKVVDSDDWVGEDALMALLDTIEHTPEEELPDLFALADVVISRAGANAICEISSLAKPNLLIPLSARASRGDQILNARSFEKQGYSMVLEEEELTPETLLTSVRQLYENRETFIAAMNSSSHTDSIGRILTLIQECDQSHA